VDTRSFLPDLAGAIGVVIPESILIIAACVMFAFAPFHRKERTWSSLSFLILLLATFLLSPGDLFATRTEGGAVEFSSAAAMFRADDFSFFCRWIGLLTGLGLLLLSLDQIPNEYSGEYYASLLLVIAGTNLVAASNDLITLFLALELISIPTYLLLYLLRSSIRVREATTKYFLLSIFSSALLLYGLSFYYGATGSTNFEAIRSTIKAAGTNQLPDILTIGLIFVVAGLGFRLTAAPFHFYAPDVYEGAPTLPVTLLAVVPKIAGLVGLVVLVNFTLLAGRNADAPIAEQARDLFWIMALVSMVLGNVMGLLQDNFRRLMAYSSIAHAGYMLFGLGAAAAVPATGAHTGNSGLTAVFFYLAIYTVMTYGAFAVLRYLETPERPVDSIDDLAGLGRDHPVMAFFLAVFLLSLMGLPPTVGFFGKFNLFMAGWSTGIYHFRIAAIVMAVTAAIGAWYYLRIIGVMYLRQSVRPLTPPMQPPAFVAVLLCGFLTLVSFAVPNWFLHAAADATTPYVAPLPKIERE
jgi:NADH-quinone oxidoreductase subunit N